MSIHGHIDSVTKLLTYPKVRISSTGSWLDSEDSPKGDES